MVNCFLPQQIQLNGLNLSGLPDNISKITARNSGSVTGFASPFSRVVPDLQIDTERFQILKLKKRQKRKSKLQAEFYRVIWFSVLTLVSRRVQTPRRFRILSVGVWTLRNIENLLSICSSSASRGKYPAIFVIWRYVMYDLLWLPVPLWKELFSGKSTSPFRTQNCKSNIATNLLQW